MFRRNDKELARIDTLIGRSAQVQGDIDFAGGLHLDGRVAGNVRADAASGSTLSVSEHGVIEGSVDVPNVMLNGAVKGDIRARDKLVLGAKARVLGNVQYGVIEMALGAEILGKLMPGAGSGAGAATAATEAPEGALTGPP